MGAEPTFPDNRKVTPSPWKRVDSFLPSRLERISTLKNAGTVTIFRNGTVHYDSHIRLTVGKFWRVHPNMFATNVRARPLVSCKGTPAWSSCIRYCQISKWEKYTKVMLSGTCFMSFTNYPLDEQLCRVLSVSHSNSIHEVEIGHILLLLWEEIKGTHSACCRLCCGARYRTTQSSNGPCSTSLSSDTSRTTTRLWSWRTQCILYRYICTTSLIGARLLRRY